MKKTVCLLILAAALSAISIGCGSNSLSSDNSVSLSLWHPYGQQMKTSMDKLIDEFNNTIGAQKGIAVSTAYVADNSVLGEQLITAAGGDPGSPELPDIAVVYPRIAVTLAVKGRLMDFGTQFSEEELSLFVPEFLEEGRLGGETLYVLPAAKSTEVLYVNTAIFDRFAKDSGVTLAQLSTFEGILDAAEKYYSWTDAKTPDVTGDGKAFFYQEDLFNHTQIGFEQLGENFTEGEALNVSSPLFRKIWDSYYPYAVKGSIAIFNNYGNYLMQTGDIVCLTSTTASVTFYQETVTYPDNTKENADFAVLPYPVFEGGSNIAIQRGGGMCVIKSDRKKEYAAGIFLKWLMEPEQNLRFTAQTGYMPVRKDAFGEIMAREAEAAENRNIKKLFETVSQMRDNYEFFIPPVFEGYDNLRTKFTEDLRKAAVDSRREYLVLIDSMSPDEAYNTVSQRVFERFVAEH